MDEKQFETVVKDALAEHFNRGLKQGACGIAGAINDKIDEAMKSKSPSYKKLVIDIKSLVEPLIGGGKKD